MAHVLDMAERGIIPDARPARAAALLLEAYETDAADFPYDPAFGEPYNSRERFFVERIGDTAGLVARRPPAPGSGTDRAAAAPADPDRPARPRRRRRFVEETARQSRRHVADAHGRPDLPAEGAAVDVRPLPAVLRPAGAARRAPPARPNWPRSTPAPAGPAASTAPGCSTTASPLARSLGFDTVITHTRDAMWRVDDLIAVLAIGTSLISNQSKLAEDLEIFSSSEFNFVDLDDGYSRSSVLMPQKRNPYALSIVRGASGVLIGRLTGFLAVTKSPSARSDNFIFAYGEVPRALDLALRVTDLMSGVVRTLQVNPDRMREELDQGLRPVDRPGRAPHPDPRRRLPHRLLRRRRRRARREPGGHPRAATSPRR